MNYRPHMLPKVRSTRIRNLPKIYREQTGDFMPCTLRIASFVGLSCAPDETCCMDHTSGPDKGASTKTSDLEAVCGCATCHRLLDQPSPKERHWLLEHGGAVEFRLRQAGRETRAAMLEMGIIIIPDAEFTK